MSAVEEFSENLIKVDFASLPQETVDRAKWRILDAIGCLMAGTHGPGCREVADLIFEWGGAPQATVITHGTRVPAHNAAMVNSLMTRSYDFEPVEAEGDGRSVPAHISGTTVPTALAMAEWQGASGKELIAALTIGDDLSARLGVASGFDFSLGWDNTGTINAFGAAAIACKLMRLDAGQTANAFGIVLNQLSGTLDGVWDKAMTFKLPMALAGRAGIVSAELAARGFTGPRDPFLGRYGFFTLFSREADTSDLTKDLGKRFYADRVIKPYSACRLTHPSIDCALDIMRVSDVRVEDIQTITVHLHPGDFGGFTAQPFVPGRTPQIEGAFSISYTVATALLRRSVKPGHFGDGCLEDAKIGELLAKMRLVADLQPDLAGGVDVRTADGKLFSSSTDFPRGDVFLTPLTEDEIKAKFRGNMAFSGRAAAGRTEEALQMLGDLESVSDVREVVALLA